MTAPLLRAAQPADVPGLARFARDSFAATYGPDFDAGRIAIHCANVLGDERVRAFVEDPAQRVLLACRGERVVAFAQWGPAEAPVAARQPAELKRFYVDTGEHGSGLAQRLFAAVREDAQTGGADLLWCCVYAGNARARRFYERQGMALIGQVPYVFVDQVTDDLALGLRLP
jgi:diamine N-acetyltransferase